jgi:hypothetical protein
MYSLGPTRQYDAKRQQQILKVLETLTSDKNAVMLLKKIGKPYSHKYADQIIRDTMQLPPNTPITDAHARRAALSAWMCTLRQNVGSCFATAPAEIVHDEQAELFLQDINELLNTGRLKRTFGGVEYAVPLSYSWGSGDLKKPILVRTQDSQNQAEIWLSPGLVAAFESAGVLDSTIPIKAKIQQIKEWVQELQQKEQGRLYFILTAEDLIQNVLMNHLNITEKDLKEYENRPQGTMQTSLLVHMPKAAASIGEASAKFHQLYETAANAFKALSDNALLKSWEFTLASFSETKAQFATWNLYSSLGLGSQEPGGIGERLYAILQHKLEHWNEQVQDYQSQYEQAYVQVKYLESRIQNASTEKEVQWLKIEYQAKMHNFYFVEEMRNTVHAKAQRIAGLFNLLIDLYMGFFPEYFQEIYDADMQDVTTGPYDDSPAGFRLLYKHGRTNTAQWTRITNANEFVDALSSFFIATETQIASMPELKGLEQDFSEIVTAVVNHIKTKEFLETAFHRMAMAHRTPIIKNPLEHLDKIEKKPWAYTSGGTMDTLVSCYYRREDKPTEVGRWIENDMELLVFLVDTLKQTPPVIQQEFEKKENKAMLMHSPTHAFLFKPGLSDFKKLWENDAFTYTWLRDHVVLPAQRFVEGMILDEEKMGYMIDQLILRLPAHAHHHFRKAMAHPYAQMTPPEFRNHIVTTMAYDPTLRPLLNLLSPDDIDGFLFSSLPIFSRYLLRERIELILNHLPGISQEIINKALDFFDQTNPSIGTTALISASQLQDITKGLLVYALDRTSVEYDYHWFISRVAQQQGFAMPTPIIIADTNWVKDEFAFVINPGTGRWEFWRMDYTGSVGFPMSSWREWLDGSRQDRKWGIYIRPNEYKF